MLAVLDSFLQHSPAHGEEISPFYFCQNNHYMTLHAHIEKLEET